VQLITRHKNQTSHSVAGVNHALRIDVRLIAPYVHKYEISAVILDTDESSKAKDPLRCNRHLLKYVIWESKRKYTGFPRRRPEFDPRQCHMGSVVDKVTLRQVSSEYFGLPRKFSLHQLLHIFNHPVIRCYILIPLLNSQLK
jgi:hypothetical protein